MNTERICEEATSLSICVYCTILKVAGPGSSYSTPVKTASAVLPQHQIKHTSNNGRVQHAMQSETTKLYQGTLQRRMTKSTTTVPCKIDKQRNLPRQGPHGIVVCRTKQQWGWGWGGGGLNFSKALLDSEIDFQT